MGWAGKSSWKDSLVGLSCPLLSIEELTIPGLPSGGEVEEKGKVGSGKPQCLEYSALRGQGV